VENCQRDDQVRPRPNLEEGGGETEADSLMLDVESTKLNSEEGF
jgi:hypothetical protein